MGHAVVHLYAIAFRILRVKDSDKVTGDSKNEWGLRDLKDLLC